MGIVSGTSETEFNPNGDITRQEAAAMLMRVYENFVIVYGAWSMRHTTELYYTLYVFDKSGGVPYVSSVAEDMKWEVSSDESIITCYVNFKNTFRLYHKLDGTEKVYDMSLYKTEYDVIQGKFLGVEKVNQ